jgi:hypothetical protein
MAEMHHVYRSEWNPDGKLWRAMPKSLVAPFQAQAARTTKNVKIGAILATVLIQFLGARVAARRSKAAANADESPHRGASR